MKTRETKYSIGELAALTGVTRRTIRFYVQKGLLQSPLGRGRGRHYTEEHAERIMKIRALQKDGVPLDQMADVLRGGPVFSGEKLEKCLVTRVRLADGVWMEFSGGRNVPSPGKLAQLVESCRKILGISAVEK